MQKLFIIAFLLITCFHVKGQWITDNQQETEKAPFQKNIIVRVNFAGLLDFYDQNISLGAEYPFNPQWSAGIDAGYIFQSEYIRENTGVKGMILRPFIRYYFKEKRTGFLEANLHYKNVVYKVKDWIGRDITNGIPAYEELSIFDFNKNVYGINVVIGNKWNLDKKNNRIKLEPYAGLGARIRRQKSGNGSFAFNNNWFSPDFEPKFSYLAILMGMRLTFKL